MTGGGYVCVKHSTALPALLACLTVTLNLPEEGMPASGRGELASGLCGGQYTRPPPAPFYKFFTRSGPACITLLVFMPHDPVTDVLPAQRERQHHDAPSTGIPVCSINPDRSEDAGPLARDSGTPPPPPSTNPKGAARCFCRLRVAVGQEHQAPLAAVIPPPSSSWPRLPCPRAPHGEHTCHPVPVLSAPPRCPKRRLF